MVPRWKWLGLAALVAAALLAARSALPAEKKGDDARRREAARLDQEIRRNQQRLDGLRREEAQLRTQVQNLEKKLPGLRERVKKGETELATAKGEMAEAQKAIDAAESAVKQATQYLAQVVKQIEDSQPEGSAFAKARAAYLAAKQVHERALDAVQESPEYKEALEKAKASPDRLKAFPEVRKQYLDKNPAVVEALADLTGKRQVYEDLRTGLLSRDKGWREASEALTRAKSKEIEAEQQGRAKAGKQTSLTKELADARRDLKAGETTLANGQAQLKRYPALCDAIEREIHRDRQARARLR